MATSFLGPLGRLDTLSRLRPGLRVDKKETEGDWRVNEGGGWEEWPDGR